MFDRGLISVADDMKILKSTSYPLGDVEELINRDGYLILPDNPVLHPHPAFPGFHRDATFKA